MRGSLTFGEDGHVAVAARRLLSTGDSVEIGVRGDKVVVAGVGNLALAHAD